MSFSTTTFPDSSDFGDFGGSSTSTSYSSGGCEQLSPHDRFLSTILTSFIGAVITGISGGWFIAFCTAWISWFATLRIVAVGMWFVWRAVRGFTLDGGITFYENFPLLNRLPGMKSGQLRKRLNAMGEDYQQMSSSSNEEGHELHNRAPDNSAPTEAPPPYDSGAYTTANPQQLDATETTKAAKSVAKRVVGFQKGPPTILGWAGWIYASCYFPIVQILWLAGNWANGPSAGNLKLVRALSISVTALALTMDTKARYAVSVGERYGPWARQTFTIIHAFSTLILGVIAVIMLTVGVIQMKGVPLFFIPVVIFFSFVWMFGSFLLFPPMDGGMPPNSVLTFLAGLVMGVFCGAFTSAAALGSIGFASTDGATIGQYLGCEGVEVWRKFIAIFP
jgi:hypothetical protein